MSDGVTANGDRALGRVIREWLIPGALMAGLSVVGWYGARIVDKLDTVDKGVNELKTTTAVAMSEIANLKQWRSETFYLNSANGSRRLP